MSLNEIQHASEYLSYFDQQFLHGVLRDKPVLTDYYCTLRHQMIELSTEEGNTLFEGSRQLLALDAKLQILFQLTQMQRELEKEDLFTEEEIIQMVETDSHCFYRELIGAKKTDAVSWGVLFLSEQMKDVSHERKSYNCNVNKT